MQEVPFASQLLRRPLDNGLPVVFKIASAQGSNELDDSHRKRTRRLDLLDQAVDGRAPTDPQQALGLKVVEQDLGSDKPEPGSRAVRSRWPVWGIRPRPP